MNIREIESQMRDLTDEERESFNNYIESISVTTGFNFYDLINDYHPEDCLVSPRDPDIDLPREYPYNKKIE